MIERKQQIIELSIELVKEYGYDSFSYATLSKSLGITKASIHHHFSTKDELGLAICRYLHQQMKLGFDKILAQENLASEKLEEYLSLYENIMDDGSKICPIASLQAEVQIISDDMKEMLRKIDHLESEFLQELLTQGKNSNEFTLGDNVEVEAINMAVSLKGAVLYSRLHGKEQYRKITELLVKKLC